MRQPSVGYLRHIDTSYLHHLKLRFVFVSMACFGNKLSKNVKRSEPIDLSENLLSPSDRLELSVDPDEAWRVLQVLVT